MNSISFQSTRLSPEIKKEIKKREQKRKDKQEHHKKSKKILGDIKNHPNNFVLPVPDYLKGSCPPHGISMAELPPVKRIIAIGDIHGDWDAMKLALQAAKVINSKGHWVGKKTIVVFIGDIIDRYRALESEDDISTTVTDEMSEKKILKYLYRLDTQARKVGGAVFPMVGNHEFMNVHQAFDYVSELGMEDFKGKRTSVFKPGRKWAKRLACRNVVLKIGGWLFMHGGMVPNVAKKYNLEQMNDYMRKYFGGIIDKPEKIHHDHVFKNKTLDIDTSGITWFKGYSRLQDKHCKELEEVLKIFGARGMIVAHVPQERGINSGCGGKIWRVDIGMSEAFGPNVNSSLNDKNEFYLESLAARFTRTPQVLEILDDKKPTVLIPYSFFTQKHKKIKAGIKKLEKDIPGQQAWIDEIWDEIYNLESKHDYGDKYEKKYRTVKDEEWMIGEWKKFLKKMKLNDRKMEKLIKKINPRTNRVKMKNKIFVNENLCYLPNCSSLMGKKRRKIKRNKRSHLKAVRRRDRKGHMRTVYIKK